MSIRSTTNPSIDSSSVRVREGGHSSEPVVAVQDTEAERIALQNDRDRHPSCTCNVIAGTEKLCLSIRDVCDACMKLDAGIVLDNCGNDILRAWVEESKSKGEFVPFPRAPGAARVCASGKCRCLSIDR